MTGIMSVDVYVHVETDVSKCGRRRKKKNLLHWAIKQQSLRLFEPEKPKKN